MDEDWDGIAEWYAELVRGGSAMHRFSRDILLKALPANVIGLNILDVGCGEGIVSRALAGLGARVVGIDPTRALVAHAEAAERANPTGAVYRIDDGSTLQTVPDCSVDGVAAALSLNNIADLDAALTSARRAGNVHRAISTYVTAVLEHGFVLRSLDEPAPSDEVSAAAPHRLGLPPFLVISATLR